MSDEKKIYVGSGVGKFGNNLIDISVCVTDAEAHIFEYNGKKYLKLSVGLKKEVDKYGKTHSVSINTWKPEQKEAEKLQQSETQQSDNQEVGDLPF